MGSSQSHSQNSHSTALPPKLCFLPWTRHMRSLLLKLRRSLHKHQHARHAGRRRRAAGGRRLIRQSSSCALLRPMPRCSSFGSGGTLLTPSKRSKPDCHYAQWKCMFEHAAAMPAERPHDISEALSGQTTPSGFPSHTDVRCCQAKPQPRYDYVGEIKVRRRLSFRLPKLSADTSALPRATAKQRNLQAHLEAQLQRDLSDLQEYYGGFCYARQSVERLLVYG